jgi:hypothetical protein
MDQPGTIEVSSITDDKLTLAIHPALAGVICDMKVLSVSHSLAASRYSQKKPCLLIYDTVQNTEVPTHTFCLQNPTRENAGCRVWGQAQASHAWSFWQRVQTLVTVACPSFLLLLDLPSGTMTRYQHAAIVRKPFD